MFGKQKRVLLIPREGKNKTIYISRNGITAIYISKGLNGYPFRKEGANDIVVANNNKNAESLMRLLKTRKRLAHKALNGFWKQSNNKSTLDFKGDKNLIYKFKKKIFENATYDIIIENEKLYLIFYDENLNELYKGKIRITRDEMRIGTRNYYKF